MKKIIVLLIIVVFLSGCAQDITVDNKKVTSYGLFNKSEKQDNVEYRTCVGNVILGIILFETLAAPVYFFGFSMYEPVKAKKVKDSKEATE